MKYTKFIIENYKGIQFLELDLEKRPSSKVITLIGLNESGKTSILEAISFLHYGLPTDYAHQLIPKKDKINFTGSIKVKAFIKFGAEDNSLLRNFSKSIGISAIKPITEITIAREFEFENSNFIEEHNFWNISIEIKEAFLSDFTSLNSKDEKWKQLIFYIRNSLLPKILYYPNFLFDFPSKIYLDFETSQKFQQVQFRDIIQDILTSIDSELTIENHLIHRLQNKDDDSNKESLEHTLSKMSAKITKVVMGAWKNIMNIRGKEIIVSADVEKSDTLPVIPSGNPTTLTKPIKDKYYIEFRFKEGTEKYYISERSLGFKWFFTFLLFTEFRKNRVSDSGETLFLLDEPASNLHSTAQKKLLTKFSDLAKNSCLIYTTHSHHLVNPKWIGGAYIVKNNAIDYKRSFDFDSKNTDIKAIPFRQFVASHPNQKDYFQPVLDALDYQPGLLEKIPSIIITEGKFDYYTLKYFTDIIFKSSKLKNLHFFPGNGAGQNNHIIGLYLSWARPFAILLDSDKQGKKSQGIYLKEFGEIIKPLILTYSDLNEDLSGFSMEQLFSEEEQINITKLFNPEEKKFNKSSFNTALQELYINEKIYPFSEVTKQKIFNLLDTLNKKMRNINTGLI
jgi:predicted ATPase